MGSSSPHRASPDFLAVFREHADASGTMPFAQFMELALYHPGVGYYRRPKERIGYGVETDFFTASSSGPLFGELVAHASAEVLRNAGRHPADHTFIELGAETTGGVLAGVTHPFANARTARVGEPISLAGDCVVFSNELFDAQPCVRTVARGERWHEIGVRIEQESLIEVELSSPYREPAAPEGYRFDRPIAAAGLADSIAAQRWRGLFVAFDYGKTLHELARETPAGTARAYFRHAQSNDLLAHPGEQDLTCHICWDWMTDALYRHGFGECHLEFQETFFVRHASEAIESISTADAARFSSRKLALLQLLHPAHLGQKFQVLHAVR